MGMWTCHVRNTSRCQHDMDKFYPACGSQCFSQVEQAHAPRPPRPDTRTGVVYCIPGIRVSDTRYVPTDSESDRYRTYEFRVVRLRENVMII